MNREQIEHDLVHYLQNQEVGSSIEYAKYDIAFHNELMGVVKSLAAAYRADYTNIGEYTCYKPTEEGQIIVDTGSHEARLFALIPDAGIPLDDLKALMDAQYFDVAMGGCRKNKWVTSGADKIVTKTVTEIKDQTQNDLADIGRLMTEEAIKAFSPTLAKNLAMLKKRKLIDTVSVKYSKIFKGPKFSLQKVEYIADLDIHTLRSGAWETGEFKDYNFAAEGKSLAVGALHPLQKVKIEFTKILTNMGFSEMDTTKYVESSFWNFDTLFQPQQHPARDAHDTFFLSAPELCNMETTATAEYIKKVKDVHEIGGYGSTGYHYDWAIEEASKNILRTHTTACSSRVLYSLATEYKEECRIAEEKGLPKPEFKPRRFFSIDRVFRNETLDATHLAEFNQVEGMVIGKDLTLGNLIAVIKTFFESIGVDDVKFKPAFNPYTEPSLEIFGFSKELNRWIEVGNSGIFRPEMIEPMGIPSDIRVIAWGLSLERPTMIKYGYKNIRDLVGPRMQLRMIEKNPIARYP